MSRSVTIGEVWLDPRKTGPGSGGRESGDRQHESRLKNVVRVEQRNPTAVQSGNRQATLLGERSRLKIVAINRLCEAQKEFRDEKESKDFRESRESIEPHAEGTEAGPGREQVAQRFGPMR